MAGTWSALIRYALEGVPDDPYVRLLKERLRSGSQLIRIDLVTTGSQPEYVVILSLQRQLSEMRLPHSEAFTNWSFETGAKLATEEQETARFALLLDPQFSRVRDELGANLFDSTLVQHVRALNPSRATAAFQPLRLPPHATSESRDKQRAVRRIEDVLVSLARALGRSLQYDEAMASRILDGALAQWVAYRFVPTVQEATREAVDGLFPE